MRISLLTGAAFIALGAVPVSAQTVNYGTLEEIFGEPVTTSATGSAQKASDAPVAMEIITADDIRRSGADSVPDVLRFVAGIDVRQYGASDFDVGIRGYDAPNSPRVLVLLNGRQIYIDFHSYTAWSTLPVQLEEIRQIEVIKGPNTALFGFNAVGGVINIVTFDPLFDTVREATARVGTGSDQQLSGVGTVHFGDSAGLRLSASEHGQNELPTYGQTTAFGPYPSDDYAKSAYAHARALLPSGIDFTAEADAVESKQFEVTVGGYPGWTEYNANHEKIDVGSATALGYLNVNAYRNWVEFRYLPGENCLTCITIANELYVVQASDLFKPAAGHTIRLALEYRDNSGRGSAYTGERFGFDVYAASAMWNWEATQKIAITNSVRYDYMTFNYAGPVAPTIQYTAAQYNRSAISQPSVNSAIVYKATDADTVRVSYGRGVQTPDFYSLYPQPISTTPGYTAGTVNAFEGSPVIKPTLITNYETDYDHALPALNSKAQFSVFFQTSRDVIAPPGDAEANQIVDPVAGTVYGYSGNIGQSTAMGGEFNLKGADSTGWRWKLGYAFELIRDRLQVNQDPSNPDSSIDNKHGTPTSVIVANLGRTWNAWEIDASARWQSSFQEIAIGPSGASFQTDPIKSYLMADLRVGYAITENLTLATSGQQLNANKLTATSGTPLERRIIGSATLHF